MGKEQEAAKVVKRHYSEKGGHKERGIFHRKQRSLNYTSRALEFQYAEVGWNIRRKMQRNPQSGR